MPALPDKLSSILLKRRSLGNQGRGVFFQGYNQSSGLARI
jgi:hypothetical protein